jgi:hypothetical protein
LVLTIICDLCCLVPLQLLLPQLEFAGERFGAIGNRGARCAERDK